MENGLPLPASTCPLSISGAADAYIYRSETVVKVVNTQDNLKVMHLREQNKSVKHVSFHPSGTYLSVSSIDGIVYIYNLSSEQPSLYKRLDGVIRALDADSEETSKVAWHPNGSAFAVATATRGTDMKLQSIEAC